jgi:hypothetical protein
MIGRARIHVREPKAARYATFEDFRRIFSEDSNVLYELSFLLTADPEKADRCFVSGFEDCATGNPVFHEWAHSWAKRTIIQNAIEELKPRPRHSNSPLSATSPEIDQPLISPDGHFEIDAVLGLEDFERFVFVISVLEHYSEHDCTLLLSCSVQQFREARTRALRRIANSGVPLSPVNSWWVASLIAQVLWSKTLTRPTDDSRRSICSDARCRAPLHVDSAPASRCADSRVHRCLLRPDYLQARAG